MKGKTLAHGNTLLGAIVAAQLSVFAAAAQSTSPAPDCLVDAPAGWSAHDGAIASPDHKIVVRVSALASEAAAVNVFIATGASKVAAGRPDVQMFQKPPAAGVDGEFDSAVGGTPACAVRVTYADAASEAQARSLAASIHCAQHH